jgi:hypothetical protein
MRKNHDETYQLDFQLCDGHWTKDDFIKTEVAEVSLSEELTFEPYVPATFDSPAEGGGFEIGKTTIEKDFTFRGKTYKEGEQFPEDLYSYLEEPSDGEMIFWGESGKELIVKFEKWEYERLECEVESNPPRCDDNPPDRDDR